MTAATSNRNASTSAWDDARLLIESVVDYAIFMIDVSGRVATWNRGAENIKGYTAEEIIGQHFSVFYTPEDRRSGLPDRIWERVQREGRIEAEGFRVRKDGSRFWANVVMTRVQNESGEVLGYAKVTRDLTERRRAAEQLRISDERFRFLVDSVTDYAIYMLNPEGRVTTWNVGAQRMKGYDAAEIVGRHFSVFFLPEHAQAGRPERELEIARTEGRFEEEGFRVRKDGTQFWAHVIVTAVKGPDGEVLGFAKVTRDLTARRAAQEAERRLLVERAARAAAEQAEQQLRESEERYRALSNRLEIILEGVTDGITVQERSGELVFVNTAAARASGFESREELLQATTAELAERFELQDENGRPVSDRDLPGIRLLRGEPAEPMVLRVSDRVLGREWWSLVRAVPVKDAGGEVELTINIWQDITAERRRDSSAKYLGDATAALAISLDCEVMLASLARSLVAGLADACVIFLADSEPLRAVASAAREGASPDLLAEYLGGRLRALSGATMGAHLTGPELEALGYGSILLVPIRSGERLIGLLVVASAHSARRYEAGDASLLEEIGRRAGVAIENGRYFKAAQDAARTAASAAKLAEDANRVKDEFLATVSHELRTPLNAIMGWASVLRAQPLPPQVSKGIAVIHRNATAQAQIIEDILDVSRIISGKLRIEPKDADLVLVTRNSIEVVQPSASAKQIDIHLDAPEHCPLLGDAERLQQVVWNLLSNAVKFTDPGGEISISIRQEPLGVVLSVQDSGKGIDPAFLPFVFERFKQADASTTRRFGGLGLGLALVRHIVELHGGTVAAHSPGLGLGSTFTVTMPVRAAVASPARERSSPRASEAAIAPLGQLHGRRVLVVDDDADARDLVHAILTEADAEVCIAESAAEAMAALDRFNPDVLISDVAMPGEDGYSLMRRIRAGHRRVPSLALTAHSRNEDRARAAEAGFTAHISKPLTPQTLVATVANLARTARTEK